jgi:hypothetical protein
MMVSIRKGKWQRGSVLITVALTLTVLVGFAGLAIDVGSLYAHKRAMQTAADGGALEAAVAITRGDLSGTQTITTFAREGAKKNGFTHDPLAGVEVLVNQPPASGPYSGGTAFVEVIVNQPSPAYFMRVLGFSSTPVTARAVAGVVPASQYCLHLLRPNGIGFVSRSSSIVQAACDIVINSSSTISPKALTTESNAKITATRIDVTGGYDKKGSFSTDPAPTLGVPAKPDPLAALPRPHNENVACKTFPSGGKWEISGTQTLSEGVYCGGILVKSGANVTFAPGTYVLRGGNLVGNALKVDGKISGNGVTFFVTGSPAGASPYYEYKPLAFESSAVINLSAPTTGPYAGILFHQDPSRGSNSDIHRFNSSTNLTLGGVLYFPTQRLEFNSSNLTTVSGPNFGIVAWMAETNSSVKLVLGLPGESPLKRASLVE